MALTQKQENFCIAYIKCGNASEAYRKSYNAKNMTDKQIWEESSKLNSSPKVAQRLKELRDKAEKSAIITLEQRKELLSRWVWEEETPNAMKAMDLLNKMESVYTQNIKAEHSGEVGVKFHIDLGIDEDTEV